MHAEKQNIFVKRDVKRDRCTKRDSGVSKYAVREIRLVKDYSPGWHFKIGRSMGEDLQTAEKRSVSNEDFQKSSPERTYKESGKRGDGEITTKMKKDAFGVCCAIKERKTIKG